MPRGMARTVIPEDPAARRQSPRREDVSTLVVETADTGVGFTVQMLDVSHGGFRCAMACKLEPGAELLVHLGGGTVSATVRWKRALTMGCEFTTPLSDAELAGAFPDADVVRPDFHAFRRWMFDNADASEAEAAAKPRFRMPALFRRAAG